MEPSERRAVFLPQSVDAQVASMAAAEGLQVGQVLRRIIVESVSTKPATLSGPERVLVERMDRLERHLLDDRSRVTARVSTQLMLLVRLVASMRGVVDSLAEASVDSTRKEAWLQHLNGRRRAEIEAALTELETIREVSQ